MNDVQHTPGPWQVREWSSHAATTVGVPSTDRAGWFDVIAECSGIGAPFAPEQEVANARLITAAPDLLAELRELVQWAEPYNDATEANVERAQAVIAQAEGRS